VAYAVLLVALVLTLLAYHYVRQDVEDAARYRFSETVLAARGAIENQMGSYVDAMFGARALFYASDSVEMEEWSGYANGINLTERYEGMRVLGYAKRVEPEDRDEFAEELSQTFDGMSLSEPELRPEGERSVYFPMTFVEPFDEVNQRLVGYDVYSNPAYQAVMDRARDTGKAEATRKAYVLTEAPSGSRADLALSPGFVVYLPVYSEGEPISTVAQRRRALQGFVVGSLEAEGLLRGTLETFDPSSIDFEVYDGEDLTPKNLLYDEDGVLRAGEAQATTTPIGEMIREATGLPIGESEALPRLSDSGQLNMSGQEWEVYFEALPEFRTDNESNLPLFVLLSGLAVSLLLFGVTYLLVRSRLRAELASQELEDANRELEATNRELEAFSYSVAHDLRAPLRGMNGFAQVLLDGYQDKLDAEGKDWLREILQNAQKMGTLIDALLSLARLTRSELRRQPLDLSAVVKSAAARLSASDPARHVEWSIEDHHRTDADATLADALVQNLLGNAWKFTGKVGAARIEFGATQKDGTRAFFVRDNGAGFDMAYAAKLFGPFQRLHTVDEFPGTGIGLATVQRIVRRHGGRIWAEGAVGAGATFFFTFPEEAPGGSS
jgi:signal transduction histidine kinase